MWNAFVTSVRSNLRACRPIAGGIGTFGTQFMSGFAVTAIMLPCFGTLCTLFLYLKGGELGTTPFDALFFGAVGAAGFWVLTAFVFAHVASAERANPLVYAQIYARALQAEEHANRRNEGLADGLTAEIDLVKCNLRRRGLGWVTGTSYLAAWRSLHHVEEHLFQSMKSEELISEALLDEARLSGSTIEEHALLQKRLTCAMVTLQPGLDGYLRREGRAIPDDSARKDQEKDDAISTDDQIAVAKVVLQDVRRKINLFRDDRWAALIRLKQQFLTAALSLSFLVYAFAVLAVGQDAPPSTIVAALTFFGCGALAGVFQLLVVDGDSGVAVEDYGYNKTRLTFTPLVSGVAGLVGVWLLANAVTLTTISTTGDPPRAIAVRSEASGNARLPTLVEIYDVEQNRGALIVAAAFGLAPAAALSRLQRGVTEAKNDLRKSEGSQTARSSP